MHDRSCAPSSSGSSGGTAASGHGPVLLGPGGRRFQRIPAVCSRLAGSWSAAKPAVRSFPNQRRDLLAWPRRRPQALLVSGRMDVRLKCLAELKGAALINCEFCLVIGATMVKLAAETRPRIRRGGVRHAGARVPKNSAAPSWDGLRRAVADLAAAIT